MESRASSHASPMLYVIELLSSNVMNIRALVLSKPPMNL